MSAPRPLQFGLKTILAITAGVALFFAAGSWLGPAGYVIFFLLAWFGAIFAIPGWSWSKFEIIGACFAALVLAAMCVRDEPLRFSRRTAPQRSNAMHDVRRMAGGQTIEDED